MKVSVLIPFRADGGWRDRLWEFNRKQWAERCPDIEVCLGVDDTPPDSPFNAGRAINKAGDQATGDVFVTSAADFLPDPDAISEALTFLKRGAPWVALWSHTGFLTCDCTNQLLAGMDPVWRFELHAEINHAGHVLPRDTWFDVGGVDERFEGWGPEDLAFRRALETLHGDGWTVEATCVHLWHRRREEGPEANHKDANSNFYRKTYLPAVGDTKRMRTVVDQAKASRCS